MGKNKQAIGIFDSGVGGTSIWKEIQQLLPNENTIYLADSKYAPYGQKSKEEIVAYSKKNTEYLLKRGCKIIIVACNTATTNAIKILRETYDVPFIGIEPAIKPAALKTKTNAIGILATKGTLSSDLFANTSAPFRDDTLIIEQIGEGLVALIEQGAIHSDITIDLLQKYLQPMLAKNIDYLVLGCTHYPYLIPEIQKIIGKNVTIIDAGLAVAKQTKTVLKKQQLLSQNCTKGYHKFYSNKNPKVLKELVGNNEHVKVRKLRF